MFAHLRRSLLLSGSVLLAASSLMAQVTTLEGDVKDQGGKPVKDAVVQLERTDIKGHYKVKSNKKGHWFYTGLPQGTYDLSCEIDGKVVDKVNGVKSKYGDSTTVDFNTARMQQAQAAQQSGQMTDEQARGMSKEDKAKMDAQMKERSEAMKKNKALNDAFNAGQDALKAKDYKTAVAKLTEASQLDAKQVAVWQGLGDANSGLASTQTGPEKTASYDKAIEAFKKSLELKPDDAAVYNQMGNIYGAEKKIPEATEALNKAAQLDPQMAAKAFYNMGANLVNGGQTDKAADFFKKAIGADPNYADAYYQLGICQMGLAQVDNKTGKVTPPEGTAEDFQKYLELKPTGPFAQPSKDMLTSIGAGVQTNIHNPAVPTKKKK